MAIGKTPPNAPATTAPGAPPSASTYDYRHDDMFDLPEELQGNTLLPRALKILAGVCAPYWLANDQAILLQDKHRHITRYALIFATLAVSLAILQLPFLGMLQEPRDLIFPGLEFVFAGFALWYVGRGLLLAVQKHWLLERHKAERFRFLKYRCLLDLVTNSKDDSGLERWKHLASREASDILTMDEGDLEQWMEDYHRVASDEKSLLSVIPANEFDEILDYYKRKRLDRQLNYLSKKSKATREDDFLTKFFPSGFFLLSLLIALIHFAIDIVDALAGVANAHGHPKIYQFIESHGILWAKGRAVWLITAAALLPVFVAAIRTHRSANEYSRNTLRFSAMYLELRDSSKELALAQDTTAKLKTLWQCEDSLENEHRDWLRLMQDAEWYG